MRSELIMSSSCSSGTPCSSPSISTSVACWLACSSHRSSSEARWASRSAATTRPRSLDAKGFLHGAILPRSRRPKGRCRRTVLRQLVPTSPTAENTPVFASVILLPWRTSSNR